MKNSIFYYLVKKRKQERQKIGGELFPPSPHFFYPPNLGGNKEGEVLKDALYTNTLNLSCISFLSFSLP